MKNSKNYGLLLKNKKYASNEQNLRYLSSLNIKHEFEDTIFDENATFPDISLTSSVFCLIFNENENIAMVTTSKGWQVPAAHIEANETGAEAAARGVFEAMGTAPDFIGNLGFRKITCFGEPPKDGYFNHFPVSYQLFFWGIKINCSNTNANVKFFTQSKALELDFIKDNNIKFYKEALKRANFSIKEIQKII